MIKSDIQDTSDFSKEENDRLGKLAKELKNISPFDIESKEIEPLWFSHPKYEDVFFKLGRTLNNKIAGIWCTMTTDHDKAVMLTIRKATERETKYFIAKTSNA